MEHYNINDTNNYPLGDSETTLRNLVNAERSSISGLATIAVLLIIITMILAAGLIVYKNYFSTYGILIGILLLTEGMILAYYLAHDCAHLVAFKSKKQNLILGEFLSIISGYALYSFSNYRYYHMRHHAETADLVGVDIRNRLSEKPPIVINSLLFLESIYVPAIFLIVRLFDIKDICATGNTAQRSRLSLVTLLYLGFGGILVASGQYAIIIIWLCATVLRIHVIRFVDAFQHNYDQHDHEIREKSLGRGFEQLNTFSYPVARRWKILNLTILNFGFHNAHHAAPSCPWFKLPIMDLKVREVLKQVPILDTVDEQKSEIEFVDLIKNYHRYRVERVLSGNAGHPFGDDFQITFNKFTGAFTDNLLG